MAEWWVVTFTDEAWSFSTMVAARFAFELLEETAKDLGLKPDSREANKLAWFVLSRVGDFKIYEVYQRPASIGKQPSSLSDRFSMILRLMRYRSAKATIV